MRSFACERSERAKRSINDEVQRDRSFARAKSDGRLSKRDALAVEERSVGLRRCLVRDAGGIRSANADMSSVKAGEKPARRKPKVSCSTFIGAG